MPGCLGFFSFLITFADKTNASFLMDNNMAGRKTGTTCPNEPNCSCYHPIGYRHSTFVDCRHRKLSEVPRNLPRDTIYLDLSSNQIEELGRLSFIKYPDLQYLNLSMNDVTCLNNDTFGPIVNLRTLDIQHCSISKIEKNTFSGLKSLEYLDVSENRMLTFKTLPNISHGLTFTNIKILKVNGIHQRFGPCIMVSTSDIQQLNETSLTELYMDSNRIATVDWRAIPFFPKTVEIFSAKDNWFLLDCYFVYMYFNFPFPNLRRFILADQHQTGFFGPFDKWIRNSSPVVYQSTGSITEGLSPRCNFSEIKLTGHSEVQTHTMDYFNVHAIIDKIPQNLSYIDLSNFKFEHSLGSLRMITPNNLTHLILSRNIIGTLIGPLHGFDNLTHFDFSWNYCDNISQVALKFMFNLRHLNLSSNFLGLSLAFDTEGKTLQNQAKLQNLDLSSNRIVTLPADIFGSLYGLEILNLSRNFMSTLEVKFNKINKLKYLDLSNNMLQTLTKQSRETFDSLALASNITLNLVGNKFRCSCNKTNQDFLKWISDTRVKLENQRHITCTFDNDTTVALSDKNKVSIIYASLKRECQSYILLIIVSISLTVLAISLIISALIYRFRWNLRYMYYMAKFKYKGYKPVMGDRHEYKYDVFVSYADEDRRFIRHEVVEYLERNKGLRLLIHDRDFLAGEFVGDNIVKAISTSRKTLIVMSKDFLKSKWSMFELNMARMEAFERGDSCVCVLLKQWVDSKDLPLEVMDLIKRQTYIEYPETADLKEMFWERLAFSLTD